MEVHEKIRFLREAKNWSQEDMAEKLNMSISGYSKIERGTTKAYFSKMKQIAEVLDVDLIELIPLDGKNIYLNNNYSNNGDGGQIIASPAELAFEVQKLQLINQHQHEIISQKDKDISRLEEMLAMQKKLNATAQK